MYSQEKSVGSFWIGVQNINGSWIKSDGQLLSNYEVNLVNNETDGDCIIADSTVNYLHRAVSCADPYQVPITISQMHMP